MIASPIGNLSDISQRALDVLSSVDYVLCEDTRHTKRLLDRYSINTRLVSLHQHSTEDKLFSIIDDLKAGQKVACVSDSGTPNLSDPGGRLVEMAYGENLEVSPIPGASALASLVSVAPFACSDFRFIGFFPKKKGRETLARELKSIKYPVFFFESPKRIRKTIAFLQSKLPNKKLLIGRELTKIYEQIQVLDLSKINEHNINEVPEKGEFVLAIFG